MHLISGGWGILYAGIQINCVTLLEQWRVSQCSDPEGKQSALTQSSGNPSDTAQQESAAHREHGFWDESPGEAVETHHLCLFSLQENVFKKTKQKKTILYLKEYSLGGENWFASFSKPFWFKNKLFHLVGFFGLSCVCVFLYIYVLIYTFRADTQKIKVLLLF